MPERRTCVRLWAVLTAVVVTVLALMALRASGQRSALLQSNGVPLERAVVRLDAPRQLACERAVVLAAPSRTLRLWGAGFVTGSRFRLVVRDTVSRTFLADGRGRAGEGVAPLEVRLSRTVSDARPVDVCVRIAGPGRLEIWGSDGSGPGRVSPGQQELAVRGVGPVLGDARIDVLRPAPRSVLARVPRALVRAGTFKPLGIGAWTWWLALAAAVGLAPLVLARAVARAAAEDAGSSGGPVAGEPRAPGTADEP